MRLAARQQDGSTLLQHLQAAAAAGVPADPLLLRQAPAEGAAVWEAFVALNGARQSGMERGAILPSEIVAWQQLLGVRLTAWEADTLMAMDRAALAVAAEKPKAH